MAKSRTSRKIEATEATEAEVLEVEGNDLLDESEPSDETTEASTASTPSDQEAILNARIAELEAKLAAKGSNMITTANMPGGTAPIVAPAVPVANQADKAPVRRYKGNELGKCRHTVYSAKGHRRAEYSLTLEPSVVYHLVLVDGQAQVPDRVADYIRRENPGNALRMG